MHSISDLTTFARKTKGHVPPQLVGASTTVVGNKMYLFGGRLVTARRMTSDMYVFDLETFVWEKLPSPPADSSPSARYFHSADNCDDKTLVIFGGMGYVSPDSEDLCVLNDVRLFDLASHKWLPPPPSPPATSNPELIPRARYAHLSSVTRSQLFIIGGQDMTNVWLDDIHVFDLLSLQWVERRDYPRHCGTYRSVAVSGRLRVRNEPPSSGEGLLGPPGGRFAVDGGPSTSNRVISDELAHLSYSAAPTEEFPCDIMLYSNYNFTDVRRELEVISPTNPFTITDKSDAMTGASLPPGLRFPTGAILGTHLIIAGTYLAHSYQSFSIWSLDLTNMQWTRIDAGTTLQTGSWSRGVLWSASPSPKFLIFGNRAGNLVEDYNRRLLSWDHVAYIDLEAFGIYQPPKLLLDVRTQELGLAALEEGVLADFEVVCEDGRRIPCSRRTLQERWIWFGEQRKKYLRAARRALDTLPGPQSHPTEEDDDRPDPRLTPRSLHLSEPYPVALALLQYIYSLSLLTPLQHSPPVLSALLLLATTYKIPHLESLVKHAMHSTLGPASSVGVYEVATLCDCQSLQIRALKVVMSSSRRPANGTAATKNGPGGPAPPQGGRDGDRNRPRGLSDARRRADTADSGTDGPRGGGGSGFVGTVASAGVQHTVDDGNVQMQRQGGAPMRMPRRPATADSPSSSSPVVGTRPFGTPNDREQGRIRLPPVMDQGPGHQRMGSGGRALEVPRDTPQVIVSRTSQEEQQHHDPTTEEEDGRETSDDEDVLASSFPAPPVTNARSPPSSFSRATGQAQIRRKLSDVSSTSSLSPRVSAASAASSRRRTGSDATGSTEGPHTPPVSGEFTGYTAIRTLDRIEEAGGHGFAANGNPPGLNGVTSMPNLRKGSQDQTQLPYAMDESRRPSMASQDSGTSGSVYPISSGGYPSGGGSGNGSIYPTSAVRPTVNVNTNFNSYSIRQQEPIRRPSVGSFDSNSNSTSGYPQHGGLQPSSSISRLASPLSRDLNLDLELNAIQSALSDAGSGSNPYAGSSSSPSIQNRDTAPLRPMTTGTSSGDSMSLSGPAPKVDKAVEKARKALEKAEKKAKEKAEKEAMQAQAAEERRKKALATQPSAQEYFERGRYMSVMGFR